MTTEEDYPEEEYGEERFDTPIFYDGFDYTHLEPAEEEGYLKEKRENI